MKKFMKDLKRTVAGGRKSKQSPRSSLAGGGAETATDMSQENSPLHQHQHERTRSYGTDEIVDYLLLNRHDSNDDNDNDIENNQNNYNTPGTKARQRWAKLSEKVETGEVLLMASSSSNNNNNANGNQQQQRSLTQSLRAKALQEIQGSLDFSLSQCLVAVFLYIAIAVFVYSFVFDKMTVIDAM